jgi:histone H3/H4
MLIPRVAMARVVRDIMEAIPQRGAGSRRPDKITTTALLCLHEAAEAYAVSVLETSNLLATHAKRVTVVDRDIVMARRIRKDFGDVTEEDPKSGRRT